MWNAAATGMSAGDILDAPRSVSRFELPGQLEHEVRDCIARYGLCSLHESRDDDARLRCAMRSCVSAWPVTSASRRCFHRARMASSSRRATVARSSRRCSRSVFPWPILQDSSPARRLPSGCVAIASRLIRTKSRRRQRSRRRQGTASSCCPAVPARRSCGCSLWLAVVGAFGHDAGTNVAVGDAGDKAAGPAIRLNDYCDSVWLWYRASGVATVAQRRSVRVLDSCCPYYRRGMSAFRQWSDASLTGGNVPIRGGIVLRTMEGYLS